MNKIYNWYMNFRYKKGWINEYGDSIKRLKKLHSFCMDIKCNNKMNYNIEGYDQCIQPEVCFCCVHYHKATKTTKDSFAWK